MPSSNDMTPGQVGWEAYNDGMEAGGRAWPRGTYGTPYMTNRELSSWEFVAAAVIADSAVAWEAAMAELVAENDEMRRDIAEYDLMGERLLELCRHRLGTFAVHGSFDGVEQLATQRDEAINCRNIAIQEKRDIERDLAAAASSLALTQVQREAIMAVIRNAQSSGIAFAYQKERKYPEYSVLRAIAEIETILEGNDDQVDGS